MRFVLSLFVVVVTCVTASTKYQSEEYDFLNHYRNDMEKLRQIVTMSLILPDRETVTRFTTIISTVSQSFSMPTRQTVMELTTTTSTITCTKSVANKCVRQRPTPTPRPTRPTRPAARPARVPVSAATYTVETDGEEMATLDSTITIPAEGKNNPEQPAESELVSSLQETAVDEEVNGILIERISDDNEQFPIIDPSAIQTVQPTTLPKIRESRLADPQLLVIYDNQPEHIESGFLSGPYSPVVVPFSPRRYQKPDWPANHQRYGGGGQQQRQFLQQLFTITRRSTILEIDIFTVTPTCAEPGRIPQCPTEKKRTSTKKNSVTVRPTTISSSPRH